MFKKTNVRFIIIGIAIVLALYQLYWTFAYNTMPDEKREALLIDGKLGSYQERMLQLGLDLQGGMHVVLELDIPKLLENLAKNKSPEFFAALDAANEEYKATNEDFLKLFAKQVEIKDLKLIRFYSGLIDAEKAKKNADIINRLKVESKNALNRAMAIIRNRVDQFGVSEPNIQKAGEMRIIVDLAGVQDAERARALIQSTALLEFILLKDPAITQSFIASVDEYLRKGVVEKNVDSVATIADSDTTVDLKESKDKALSINELLGKEETGTVADSSDSGVVVDEELYAEKPFSSLLRNMNNMIGVPEKNVYAVKKILKDPKVQKLLPYDSKMLWSGKPELYTGADGKSENFYLLYHVNKDADMPGKFVTKAQETIGGSGSSAAGSPIVNLGMNNEGAKKFSRLTGSNIGKFLAIVLDDKVYMAPRIKVKIPSGSAYIEGFESMQEAKDLGIVLRAGALPAKVNIIEERTVGPTLGNDSIQLGIRVGIIGFLLVIGFMAFYYKGAGLIADFALALNLIFVLAVLASLQATLTLPGIAGLILTIGIAVDNNVLVFERIREELDKGKTVRAAIESGYSRAFSAIADANITTILSALILMQFGTGPIKGFAVTLFWGIIASFFTAIFVTRTIFNFRTDRKVLEKLSI